MNKQEMKAQYKERKKIGGVYIVKNKENGKAIIEAAQDLHGAINRFNFSQRTNCCVYLRMQSDWAKYGCEAFEMEVLEELEMDEKKSEKDFKEDLKALKELWAEKLSEVELY
jgi:hypothetical protein